MFQSKCHNAEIIHKLNFLIVLGVHFSNETYSEVENITTKQRNFRLFWAHISTKRVHINKENREKCIHTHTQIPIKRKKKNWTKWTKWKIVYIFRTKQCLSNLFFGWRVEFHKSKLFYTTISNVNNFIYLEMIFGMETEWACMMALCVFVEFCWIVCYSIWKRDELSLFNLCRVIFISHQIIQVMERQIEWRVRWATWKYLDKWEYGNMWI